MAVHKCPEEFKKHLTECDTMELVQLIREFQKTLPEDTEYLNATMDELKIRAL